LRDDGFDDWKNGESFGRERTFEGALANRTDVAPCRVVHGTHEWERKEVIERRYDDRVDVALWESRYCPFTFSGTIPGREKRRRQFCSEKIQTGIGD